MAEVDVKKIIDGMTIEEKIGQFFLGSVAGGESLDQVKRNMEKLRFGGFSFSYIFERFIRGGSYIPCGISRKVPIVETAEFLHEIKKAAFDIIGVPVIPACDQEGGMEESLYRRDNVVLTPSQMGMGAAGTPADAYAAGTIAANQLKAIGMDMFLGPCMDVNSNPKNPEIAHRSFGDQPEFVAEMGEQVIKAYMEQGIITTAKHFPGRGNSEQNAHSDLDVLDMEREHFEEIEFVPFRRAIAAGVETVMLAHTIYPGLGEDKLPASFSPTIIQDVLRGDLGFEGIVYPDDITMLAISNNYEIPTACAMCVEAGCDMILMKVNKLIGPAIEAIKKLVTDGRITEERINESAERILRLKVKYGLFERPELDREKVLSAVGSEEHVEAGRKLARRAVLALKNNRDIFPLRADQYTNPLVIVPRDLSVVVSNDPLRSHDMLARSLRRYFPDTLHTVIDQPPNEHQRYEVEGLIKNADLVIYCIYALVSAEGQKDSADPMLDFLDFVVDQGKPVVVILSGAPYAGARVNEKVRGIACSFSITPLTLEAVVDLMAGKIPPHGKLSVHISDAMPRGFAAAIEPA